MTLDQQLQRQAILRDALERGFRYASSLCHDTHRAEDLLHDAFTRLLASREPISVPLLLVAIRHRFIDQERREDLVEFESLDERSEREALASLEDSSPEVDPQRVQSALSRLRPVERETLYLACVEGYSCSQIAELFSRPRGSITSLLWRAQAKLRDLLSGTRQEERR